MASSLQIEHHKIFLHAAYNTASGDLDLGRCTPPHFTTVIIFNNSRIMNKITYPSMYRLKHAWIMQNSQKNVLFLIRSEFET